MYRISRCFVGQRHRYHHYISNSSYHATNTTNNQIGKDGEISTALSTVVERTTGKMMHESSNSEREEKTDAIGNPITSEEIEQKAKMDEDLEKVCVLFVIDIEPE